MRYSLGVWLIYEISYEIDLEQRTHVENDVQAWMQCEKIDRVRY